MISIRSQQILQWFLIDIWCGTNKQIEQSEPHYILVKEADFCSRRFQSHPFLNVLFTRSEGRLESG